MGRRCQLTGKRPRTGKSKSLRGISKKKKGIGLNITGTVKRRFLPNLHTKKFFDPETKSTVTLRLTTSAMRTIDKIGISAALRKMRKTRA